MENKSSVSKHQTDKMECKTTMEKRKLKKYRESFNLPAVWAMKAKEGLPSGGKIHEHIVE